MPTLLTSKTRWVVFCSFLLLPQVGRLVLSVCSSIPHGVLVFFPSYKMLNNMVERWQSTGAWTRLFDKKHIIQVPLLLLRRPPLLAGAKV